jgi:hypothetical protein
MGAVLAALAALALGGSALASAAHKSAPPTPPAAQIPSNQAAPDTSSEVADSAIEAQSGAADTDNVQQGDQTGTHQADSQSEQAGSDQADSQSEQAGSESGPSDGPADTSPNASTQQ